MKTKRVSILRKNRGGFSLIEVVVSMGVLSVAVLSSLALLGRSVGMRADSVMDSLAPMIVGKVAGELALVTRQSVFTGASGNPPASTTGEDRRLTARALPLDKPSLQTAGGEKLVLGFTSDGQALGLISRNDWMDGVTDGDAVILVMCEGVEDAVNSQLIQATVTFSYPAEAPLESRRIKSYPITLNVPR